MINQAVSPFKRTHICGCPVDVATYSETIAFVEECIVTRQQCRHGCLNANKVVLARENPELLRALNTCDFVSADGMSVVWASRLSGRVNNLPEKVTGSRVMLDLVALSAEKGYRIFFFGARENVGLRMIEIFKEKYPALQVAGYRNGYFATEDEPVIASQINEANADILFVGFGSPMKEFWLEKWVPRLNVPFCMGVGGSFDVASGLRKGAPLWVQNTGFEWLFRLIQEPRRLWKRYLINNLKFISLFLSSNGIGVANKKIQHNE